MLGAAIRSGSGRGPERGSARLTRPTSSRRTSLGTGDVSASNCRALRHSPLTAASTRANHSGQYRHRRQRRQPRQRCRHSHPAGRLAASVGSRRARILAGSRPHVSPAVRDGEVERCLQRPAASSPSQSFVVQIGRRLPRTSTGWIRPTGRSPSACLTLRRGVGVPLQQAAVPRPVLLAADLRQLHLQPGLAASPERSAGPAASRPLRGLAFAVREQSVFPAMASVTSGRG